MPVDGAGRRRVVKLGRVEVHKFVPRRIAQPHVHQSDAGQRRRRVQRQRHGLQHGRVPEQPEMHVQLTVPQHLVLQIRRLRQYLGLRLLQTTATDAST